MQRMESMFVRATESFLRILLALGTAVSCAHAADTEFSPQLWLNPGIYSYHFDRSQNLREDNVGIGAEVMLTSDHGLMAGTYVNSDRGRTRYGVYEWRPLHWQFAGTDLSLALLMGAFDGYPRYRNGGWFLAAMPVLAIEGKRFGVNLGIIPTIKDRLEGAVAVQVKLRVW